MILQIVLLNDIFEDIYLLNLHCLSTVKVFKTLVNCASLILLIDQILCNNVVDKFGTCEFTLNSA